MLSAALEMEYPLTRFGMKAALWIEPRAEVMTKIFLASLLWMSGRNSRTSRIGAVRVNFSSAVNFSMSLVRGLISIHRIGLSKCQSVGAGQAAYSSSNVSNPL